MHHSQGYHYTLDLTDRVYHLRVVIAIVIIGNYIGQNQSHFVVLYICILLIIHALKLWLTQLDVIGLVQSDQLHLINWSK